jgi:LmbE family N-acetylglucosaminyl deacetylase
VLSVSFRPNVNHLQDLNASELTRRDSLKLAGLAVGAALWGAAGPAHGADAGVSANSRRKVLVVGAHPDDPETGCGGTMALLAAAGHDVVAAYLTRGEAGIEGTSPDDAARLRTTEALEACAILAARALFLGQIDGRCEVTPQRTLEMQQVLQAEQPDIILTHWPVDTHADHRACAILVHGAWINLGKPGALFFYEVMSGVQTQNFAPTMYVDISAVAAQKQAACFVHRSQHIEREYPTSHDRMEIFRGMESGHARAEAFVQSSQSHGALPVGSDRAPGRA